MDWDIGAVIYLTAVAKLWHDAIMNGFFIRQEAGVKLGSPTAE
jgi:hypothetical protein